MSEKLEEILQRFKDDWDALERELRRFIDELRRGDSADFPDPDLIIRTSGEQRTSGIMPWQGVYSELLQYQIEGNKKLLSEYELH